ncbi:MAG TPA: hypothetical protein VM841_14730 [Actinomycetota bacterium]|nr:hypothetical protein [Actinomycetota bacterium]
MSPARSERWGSRKRRRRIVRIVVAVIVIAGVVAAIVVPRSRASRRAERAAVQTYAQVVKDLSFEGGRILQQEVKPRITDLREGVVSPEQFRREADNWIRLYQNLRKSFADAGPPERLATAARLYDDAFVAYIEAFEAFREASRLDTPEARNEAITEAVPIAERADQIFDRARGELGEQMRALGLTPPGDL